MGHPLLPLETDKRGYMKVCVIGQERRKEVKNEDNLEIYHAWTGL